MTEGIRQRLGDLVRSRMTWVAVTWVLALGMAGVLYLWTPEFAGVAGAVEVVEYRVAAPETLRVVELPVEVGTRVRKGDVLAVLDPVPLTLERDLVRAELDQRTAEARFRQITDDRAFAESVARAEDRLSLERVNATKVEAERDALRRRIRWWKAQVAAGTAPGQEVEDLAAEEAALTRQLKAQREAVAALEAQMRGGRNRMADYRGATGRGTAVAPDGVADPARAAVRVSEAQLALLESRLGALTLRAPADGVVQRVDARVGDVSQAGQTVVLVSEDVARRVFAYPSASQASMLRVGTRAYVAARDSGGTQRFEAHVVAIGPGVVPYPEVLQFRMTAAMSFGQAVILHLDGPTTLAPGQVVDVSLLKVDEPILRDPAATETAPAPGTPGSNAAPNAEAATAPLEGPLPIVVPDALARVTRFEPSGLAWVPEKDRFLVLSDDTGLPGRDEHRPWAFWMDRQGHMDPRPAEIEDAPKVSDLESVARTSDGRLWLLSSQSVSRKGNRPMARTLLLRVELREGRLVATGHASLSAALQALASARLAALGLTRRDESLKGDGLDRVLDVEGLAADGSALLVGLKQPHGTAGRALIWRIADPEGLVQAGRFAADDPAPWGHVLLGLGPDGTPAGISDLAPLPGGGLAVLGTAPPGSPLGDFGALWVTRGARSGSDVPVVKVREFPGLKPEGVSVGPGADELTIVFDEGARSPHWIRVPLPR